MTFVFDGKSLKCLSICLFYWFVAINLIKGWQFLSHFFIIVGLAHAHSLPCDVVLRASIYRGGLFL